MERLWLGLVDNSVCMLVALPIVGAVLVQAMRPFGLETIRRTALTNVLLSLCLMILMVVHFDANQQTGRDNSQRSAHVQLQTTLRWTGGSVDSGMPNIRLAVRVDGLSIWPITAMVLLTFVAVTVTIEDDAKLSAKLYSATLLLQAGVVGIFTARDVILFCVFLEFSIWPLAVLMSRHRDAETLSAIKKMCVANSIGSLTILAGLVLTVLAYSWMRTSDVNPAPPLSFLISELQFGILAWRTDDVAAESWNYVRTVIFLLITIGFTIRAIVVPVHAGSAGSTPQSPIAARILIPVTTLTVSIYGVVRWVLPLFPEIVVELAHTVSAVLLLCLIFAALLSIGSGGLAEVTKKAFIVHSILCLLAVASISAVGVYGAVFHSCGIAICSALVYVVLDRRKQKTRFDRVLLVTAIAAVIGLPGMGGFTSQAMMVFGIFETDPVVALWACLSMVLLLWAFACEVVAQSEDDPADIEARSPTSSRRVGAKTLVVLVPLLSVIVWMGVQPQFFIKRMQPTIEFVMYQYQTSSNASTNRQAREPHLSRDDRQTLE